MTMIAMSAIDIIFYSSSLTLISIFLAINVGLNNAAGIKYSLLFLLALTLLWAAEGWIYHLLPESIGFSDLRPVYFVGLITTLFGFWMVPSVYHGKQNWLFPAAMGGMLASVLLTLSLFIFPYSSLGILFNVLLIIMFLLHAFAAMTWRTYSGGFNWLAFVTPVIALVGTAIVFYGQASDELAPQLMAYSFRALFAIICILVLGTLFITYLELRKAHESAVLEALAASELEAERAQQLVEMEREYTRARTVAEQHAKQLSSASHDIRQPIASIRAELDTMREDIPEAKRARFEHIFTHFDSLISSFQQYNEGDISDSFEQEDIPVALIFNTLEKLFAEEAKNKGIKLRFAPTSLTVTASAIALLRVTSNLLGNAINHANANHILVGARRGATTIRICVLDNGQGIPESEQKSLFERGTKGACSEGSGLGLAIVNEISASEQFNLKFQSDLTQGTLWEFSVKRCPKILTNK